MTESELFIRYYPGVMALFCLLVFYPARMYAKERYFLRALVALGIAVALAHMNRWFDFWPAHRYFPSGHMTSCLGMAISLGILRPATLAITLPLLVPFGIALVLYKMHSVIDVLGAIPLVLIVYGAVHWFWRIPSVRPPLDTVADSP